MTTRTKGQLNMSLCDPGFEGGTLVQVEPANPEHVALILRADERSMDGRSNWLWFRLPNGDLIFGCFPEGDTYEHVTQVGNVISI